MPPSGYGAAGTTQDTLSVTPVVIAAAATIPPHQFVSHVESVAAITVTMPEAGEAIPGVMYIIRLQVDGGNVTVAYPEGAHNPADQVMTAVNDHVVSVSDGTYWYKLADITT